MSMNVGSSGQGDVVADMNTTPLIDVMLVLLTLLIITIPIQTNAVKLDMPQSKATLPPTPPERVQLYVDFDGTKTWDGNVVASMADLDGYFKNAAGKPVQPEIHVGVNRLARYDWVAEVLAHAQRLGVTKIGFVGVEQFQ
jgi:biopolymer transport protein ExbD